MGKERKKKIALSARLAALLRRLGGKKKPKTAAILLSGGVGARFGADVPKQFTELAGIPILIRSAKALDAAPEIDEIVIVSRKEDIAATYALCREYGIGKLSAVTIGGETRQDSALAGVSAVSPEIEYLAIHDAARCLVTEETVSEVVREAYRYRAASAASPIYDTVKTVDRDGFIKETLDRSSLLAAETPQVFYRPLYLAAAYSAKEKGTAVTDDNSLMEAIGQAVKLVLSRGENFKITTPADRIRAEAVIAEREKNKESGYENRTRI